MSTERTARTCIDSLDLFAGCTRAQRDLVARLATLTEVAAGTSLCRHGEIGTSFFVIVRGVAAVSFDGIVLTTLGDGCGFGEVALLREGGRRVADVTAETPMTILVFSRPEFATLMAELPSFARTVLTLSRERLRDTNDATLVATS